jgi:hypothetical protein
MLKVSIASAIAASTFAIATTTFAAPSQVSYNAVEPNKTSIENFETFNNGDFGASKAFNGFTASNAGGDVATTGSDYFCGSSGDECLVSNTFFEVWTFDGFASGTKFVGFDLQNLGFLGSSPNFDVTVFGNNASGSFSIEAPGLFAFGDPDGLSSVELSILDLNGASTEGLGPGQTNYTFDDVITGSSIPAGEIGAIPAPASILLFGFGLISAGLVALRRKKA